MNDGIPATSWRKSSYSAHEGGSCVEVADLSVGVAVRDSKNPSGHVHRFSRIAFKGFVEAVRETV